MQSLTAKLGFPMATMTIRNLDEALKARLRVRAAEHGKSMEEEARDILRAALSTVGGTPVDLGRAIHARFAAVGGVDLPFAPREPIREPAGFGS
jgi:antitoxin FitA